jgi:hypothetical protein
MRIWRGCRRCSQDGGASCPRYDRRTGIQDRRAKPETQYNLAIWRDGDVRTTVQMLLWRHASVVEEFRGASGLSLAEINAVATAFINWAARSDVRHDHFPKAWACLSAQVKVNSALRGAS